MVDNTRKIVYSSKSIGGILSKLATTFQFKLLSFYKDKQTSLECDLAEVGVYQGGSAKLICEVKKEKQLYLFDTFTGLPQLSDDDTHFGNKHWYENEFSNRSIESIQELLKKYNNVSIIKGNFPESGKEIIDKKFCFVHLDVDLYKSTIESLRFFFPKMVSGGIILIHDYHSDGIQKAIKEFKSENQIHLIELTGSQAMIIKNY